MNRLITAALVLLVALPALGQNQPPSFPDLDTARRAAIVETVSNAAVRNMICSSKS